MKITSIDGVPIFFAEGPAPLAVGLVFGVGRRDESFVRGGLTHLVEHLTMHTVGRTAFESNASVSIDVTEFTATGPGEGVAAFLTAVCRALGDLPVDRLAVEADVLRTEGGQAASPLVAVALADVYGASGFGLAGLREPAVRSLTAEDVREWSRRWFCRQNAALWVCGPALPELDLPLLDGDPPPAPDVPESLVVTPSWGEVAGEGGVALLAELPDTAALSTTLGVLGERLEDELRHRRGVAYSVEVDRVPVGPGRRLAVVTTDLREGHEGVAANLLWRELLRLAEHGPEENELARDRTVLEGLVADPRAAAEEVRAFAAAAVTGVTARTNDQLLAENTSVTSDDVRATAAAVRDAAFLAVPAPLDPPPPGLPQRPAWSIDEVVGREFTRRTFSDVPRGARLVVGEDGASLLLGGERRITVRWTDAVGLVRTGEGEYLLVGRDGATLPVVAADWRDGADAVGLVRQAVPAAVQVVGDDAVDEGGVLLFRASAKDVREAVALTRHGMEIGGNAEWTIVVPDGERPLATVVDDLSPMVGRRTVALVLRSTHVDLEYELYRSGTLVSRHRWGVAHGEPAVLAGATGRDPETIASLHALTGPRDDVLRQFVAVLGLPAEVVQFIDGQQPVGLERVAGRGIAGGFAGNVASAVRGDAGPRGGAGGLRGRWQEAGRTRPAWYRALHGLAAVLTLVLLWVVLASDVFAGSPVHRTYVGVLAGVGLLTSLYRLRPPPRVDSTPEPVSGL